MVNPDAAERKREGDPYYAGAHGEIWCVTEVTPSVCVRGGCLFLFALFAVTMITVPCPLSESPIECHVQESDQISILTET